jgi:glutaconyl-CoA/methylmalonyl-CoA decarboxylase subunit gamma
MEKHLRITIDGRQYDVTVEDLSEGVGQQPPVATAHAAPGAGDVTSTLGGMVDSVLVSVGQTVSQGDRLVIVEAMKMKTPMIAHRAGTVAVIAVKAGEAVDAGQLLVSLA